MATPNITTTPDTPQPPDSSDRKPIQVQSESELLACLNAELNEIRRFGARILRLERELTKEWVSLTTATCEQPDDTDYQSRLELVSGILNVVSVSTLWERPPKDFCLRLSQERCASA